MNLSIMPIFQQCSKGLIFGLAISLTLFGAYDVQLAASQGAFSSSGLDALLLGVCCAVASAVILCSDD